MRWKMRKLLTGGYSDAHLEVYGLDGELMGAALIDRSQPALTWAEQADYAGGRELQGSSKQFVPPQSHSPSDTGSEVYDVVVDRNLPDSPSINRSADKRRGERYAGSRSECTGMYAAGQ